jgi:hypothetical protein
LRCPPLTFNTANRMRSRLAGFDSEDSGRVSPHSSINRVETRSRSVTPKLLRMRSTVASVKEVAMSIL